MSSPASPFPGNVKSEVILLTPLSNLLSGGFFNETNLTSLVLNYNLTGGSFSITLIQGAIGVLPIENALITLPYGRLGVVKSVGSGVSSGGLVDIISGQITTLQATLVSASVNPPGSLINMASAASALLPVSWQTGNYPIKNFSFRGVALSGIQQLASMLLADVLIRSSGIWVVDPGQFPPDFSTFTVPKTDIVSCTQTLDFSNDVASVLNPALTQVNFVDDGDFVYDSDHAQKQAKTTVQAGAPGAQGATDFIPIPDGWLVDGNFEEWTPQDSTDLTNPNPTPTNGRYWKTFRSPTDPAMMRGITSFTRLVKQISIPKNVSTFVGSPITGITEYGVGGFGAFEWANPGVQNGIPGFNALETQLFDVISSQFLDIPNAIVLNPGASVDSGFGASNFWSIILELWTFPRVNPTVFPEGNPANPFNLPRSVVVVTPSSQVFNGLASGYYNKYLANYQRINSPRLRTQLSCVYRNILPQVGDSLILPPGVRYPGAVGRIQSVGLSMGRSGMVLNTTAERYQAVAGLWNNSSGSSFSG